MIPTEQETAGRALLTASAVVFGSILLGLGALWLAKALALL